MTAEPKTIVFYCQSLIGLGHLLRGWEIARALGREHKVLWLNGGHQLDRPSPPGVEVIRMPGLILPHHHAAPTPVDPGASLDAVRRQRTQLMLDTFQTHQPDLFLVELFPFGRNQFRFELLPTLEGIHKGRYGKMQVVCSLRDVMESKYNGKKDARKALGLLNYYFQHLLVHSDPAVQSLPDSFRWTHNIEIPLHYTGYVTNHPTPGARERKRQELGLAPNQRLIIASLGAGAVGGELLQAALNAHRLLPPDPPTHLLISTGPLLDQSLAAHLREQAASQPNTTLVTFLNDFPDYLAACDLSISLAGTTVLTALAAHAPAMILPYDNQEQPHRAQKLASLGAAIQLNPPDLQPQQLANLITKTLDAPPTPQNAVNTNGAETTARILGGIIE